MDVTALAQIARSAGIEAPLTGSALLGDGVKSVVRRLDFDGHESLALKVYTAAGVIDREIAGYRSAGGRIDELPRVVAHSGSADSTPFGWMLMSLAAGERLDLTIGWMPREERLAVLSEIGGFLSRLHSIESPSFAQLAGSTGGCATNVEYMRQRFADSIGRFVERGGDRELADQIAKWFAAQEHRLSGCSQPVVCHGDVHLENIFIKPGPDPHVTTVIDLEVSQSADPVLDLAKTLHHLAWIGEHDVLPALLAGYEDPPAWLDDALGVYIVFFDLKLWNFFAIDPQNTATTSIAQRLAEATGD